MTAEAGFILGFDPGGKTKKAFGWSVCKMDAAPRHTAYPSFRRRPESGTSRRGIRHTRHSDEGRNPERRAAGYGIPVIPSPSRNLRRRAGEGARPRANGPQQQTGVFAGREALDSSLRSE